MDPVHRDLGNVFITLRTNANAITSISGWEEVNLEERLHVFGMLLGMGMYRLPEATST